MGEEEQTLRDIAAQLETETDPSVRAILQATFDKLAPLAAPPEPPMIPGADAGIADPFAPPAGPPPGMAPGGPAARRAPGPGVSIGEATLTPPPAPTPVAPGFNAVTGAPDASPYAAMFDAPQTGAYDYPVSGPPTGTDVSGAVPPVMPDAASFTNGQAPGQATPAGLPMPSFEEWQAMQGPPRRGPNLGPQIAAQRALLQKTSAAEEASFAAVQENLATQAKLATASGEAQAAELAGAAKEYEAQQAQADQRRQAVEGEHRDYVARRDKALNDYQKMSEGERVSDLLGGNVVAAIAMGLGAFGSAVHGGPNMAMQVIQARVAEEARVRASKLDAARGRMDALDRAVLGAERGIQSEDARRAMYSAALLGKVQLHVDRQAALHGSAATAEKYKGLSAELDEARNAKLVEGAAAGLNALHKRAAAGAGKQKSIADSYVEWMKLQKLGAETGKLMDAAGVGELADDKVPAALKGRIANADVARAQLRNLRTQVEALKAEGWDTLPGYESVFRDPLDLASRKFNERFSGIGGGQGQGTGKGDSVRGLTEQQALVMPSIKLFAQALYVATANQVANVEREALVAEGKLIGNGRIDSVLKNLEAAEADVDTSLFKFTAPYAPAMVRTAFESRAKNQAQEPELRRLIGADAVPGGGTSTGAGEPLTSSGRRYGK